MTTQAFQDIWASAASQPYEPTIGKNSQLTVGFSLLVTGMQEIRRGLDGVC